jgi:hypothetical protein
MMQRATTSRRGLSPAKAKHLALLVSRMGASLTAVFALQRQAEELLRQDESVMVANPVKPKRRKRRR